MRTVSTVVKLLEGTNHQGQRVTLLWREDRPEAVACFGVGETERVRTMIDNAVTRRILCQWHFAPSPIWDYNNRELVTEYRLHLKENHHEHG